MLMLMGITLQAQQLFFETYSGYALTAYEIPEFNESQGFVPVGFRVAGGLEHVQLGVEYQRNITNPSFIMVDDVTKIETREEFEKSYFGGLLRANISSLPAYRFGFVVKAGAGKYNVSRRVYENPGESQLGDAIEYTPNWGFKAGIGISSPIYTLLHWEIGYQFNAIKWDGMQDMGVPDYNGYYHSIELGLSLNLVFGNVAKRCRRVIESGGNGRGW